MVPGVSANSPKANFHDTDKGLYYSPLVDFGASMTQVEKNLSITEGNLYVMFVMWKSRSEPAPTPIP